MPSAFVRILMIILDIGSMFGELGEVWKVFRFSCFVFFHWIWISCVSVSETRKERNDCPRIMVLVMGIGGCRGSRGGVFYCKVVIFSSVF